MSNTTEAPTAPDLSPLPKRERLNIAVAQTQGWEVWHYPEDEHAYLFPHKWFASWREDQITFLRGDGGKSIITLPRHSPPDYAGDPAAWGALMERENVWPEPVYDYASGKPVLAGWMGRWVEETESDWCAAVTSVDCPSVGLAVCAAVLSKHGIDPTPHIGD